MNKEEENALDQLKSWREYIVNHKDNVNRANDIEFYLRTALNLIDRQQKELEYYKNYTNNLCKMINKTFDEVKQSYISKDKIKEKIKELESIEPADDDYNFELQNDIHSKIDILKELLKEEE